MFVCFLLLSRQSFLSLLVILFLLFLFELIQLWIFRSLIISSFIITHVHNMRIIFLITITPIKIKTFSFTSIPIVSIAEESQFRFLTIIFSFEVFFCQNNWFPYTRFIFLLNFRTNINSKF